MADCAATSLWETSSAEADMTASLPPDARTDVAIVGGGFTGLSTALHCAEAGLAAHVIEARHIGYGGSGRNAGLVNPGMWLPPQDVRAVLGEDRGSRIVAELGEAPACVMSLIERHGIRCEATRAGTIHAAHSPKGLAGLRQRAAEWQRLGAPVEIIGRERAAEMIGSHRYYGGLFDPRAGTINPMSYSRGLARAARAAGAGISTGITVRRLQHAQDRWQLDTDAGTLTAKRVVLCTNAYTDTLWPGLERDFYRINYFQVATEPLGNQGAHILAGRQGVWDTAPIMTSIRRDADGRLILGSMGAAMGGLSDRWARRQLRRLFPELSEAGPSIAWHGSIAMTPDHLPRIHRLANGVYALVGYNGRGITTGTIFGRAMAKLLAGGNEDELPLPVTKPTPVSARALRERLFRAAFAVNQLLKSI